MYTTSSPHLTSYIIGRDHRLLQASIGRSVDELLDDDQYGDS